MIDRQPATASSVITQKPTRRFVQMNDACARDMTRNSVAMVPRNFRKARKPPLRRFAIIMGLLAAALAFGHATPVSAQSAAIDVSTDAVADSLQVRVAAQSRVAAFLDSWRQAWMGAPSRSTRTGKDERDMSERAKSLVPLPVGVAACYARIPTAPQATSSGLRANLPRCVNCSELTCDATGNRWCRCSRALHNSNMSRAGAPSSET